MFGILGSVVDRAVKVVDRAVSDPIGTAVDMVVSPVRDGLDIIDGLTEGELRLKAAASLGSAVAGNMATDQLIDWYREESDSE